MHKLAAHFEKLLSDILPDETRLEKAQTLSGEIRDFLKEMGEITTIEPHTRLIGSYAQATAIASVRDMKDMDMLLSIDPSYLDEKPSSLLTKLCNTLADYPSASEVDLTTQRRCIHLCIEDYDFHLDIVPGVALKGIEKPLKVPERNQQEWIDSDPIGLLNGLSKLNQDNLKKVAPLIRLLKHWRDVHMEIKRPKSYWLTC